MDESNYLKEKCQQVEADMLAQLQEQEARQRQEFEI
jgi:hypothetical protein